MKKEKDTYQLPSTYFESFQSRLQVQIELEKLIGSTNKGGYIVPENYFNTLSRKLTQIHSQEQTPAKVISLKNRKWHAISIAATIAIIFGLFINNNNITSTTSETIATEELSAYLETESINLHTEDILVLLTEKELNAISFDENHPEDDILNYLETYSNSYDLILE